ncbi:MAG: hypothetical protein ACI9BD_001600 [Candidatus Marinamargulisbacteria bacterium]|jgi:hypothetical protein
MLKKLISLSSKDEHRSRSAPISIGLPNGVSLSKPSSPYHFGIKQSPPLSRSYPMDKPRKVDPRYTHLYDQFRQWGVTGDLLKDALKKPPDQTPPVILPIKSKRISRMPAASEPVKILGFNRDLFDSSPSPSRRGSTSSLETISPYEGENEIVNIFTTQFRMDSDDDFQ